MTGVFFDEGTHVHEGQLLAELENADLSASVMDTKGSLQQAQARVRCLALELALLRLVLALEIVERRHECRAADEQGCYWASPMVTLADLNASDRAAFVGAVGFAFEDSPWVAERAYAVELFTALIPLRVQW